MPRHLLGTIQTAQTARLRVQEKLFLIAALNEPGKCCQAKELPVMRPRTEHLICLLRVGALATLAFFAGCGGNSGSTPAQQAALPSHGNAPAPPASKSAVIDPALAAALQTALPGAIMQVVVTLDHYPAATDVLAIQATGAQVRPFRALPMAAVQGTRLQISALPALAGVRSIYLNRQLRYSLNESVPMIGADRVWNELGITGKGVTIAVIDSGIDALHPDLPYGTKVAQNVKIAPDLFGTGPVVLEGLLNTDTNSGHGTHVSGIAAGTGAALAGKYRGVATGAKLVGVSTGEALFILAALEGFDWVMQNQSTYAIRVISNSWGTSGAFAPDDPINVASKLAHDAGMVVVFAAGNDGPRTNTLNPYCVAAWVVCMAAGSKSDLSLADFSSRGIPGDPLYHPTLTAPGVKIASARATTGVVITAFYALEIDSPSTDAVYYVKASGTSMATPHVSGVAALMLEANSALTPDQVKTTLQTSATPMPGYQQHEVGAGYLNAYQAVQAVR